MNLEDFLRLASQMREAQKQFTATQQMADEERARKLERSFDRVLLEVMGRYVLGMEQSYAARRPAIVCAAGK